MVIGAHIICTNCWACLGFGQPYQRLSYQFKRYDGERVTHTGRLNGPHQLATMADFVTIVTQLVHEPDTAAFKIAQLDADSKIKQIFELDSKFVSYRRYVIWNGDIQFVLWEV